LPDDISPEFQGRVYRIPRHPESFRDRGILFINIKATLPHDNMNQFVGRKHYTEYYSPKTREIIQKKFSVDIEYFGYEFDK